jgi:hypothetical protein
MTFFIATAVNTSNLTSSVILDVIIKCQLFCPGDCCSLNLKIFAAECANIRFYVLLHKSASEKRKAYCKVAVKKTQAYRWHTLATEVSRKNYTAGDREGAFLRVTSAVNLFQRGIL